MSLLDAMARAAREADRIALLGMTEGDAAVLVRAALAEARKQGWTLVPVEPTEEIRAALSAFNGNKAWPEELDAGWRALISASPSEV